MSSSLKGRFGYSFARIGENNVLSRNTCLNERIQNQFIILVTLNNHFILYDANDDAHSGDMFSLYACYIHNSKNASILIPSQVAVSV